METSTDIVPLPQGHNKHKETSEIESTPYNIEAEQALLGALILNNSTFEQISDFLRAEHFSQKVHSLIFQSIAHSLERGRNSQHLT